VYPHCLHVTKTGLEVPATDIEIWDWAKNNGFTVVTNDEDFMSLLQQKGYPPKIILLRIGNQKTSYIVSILTQHQAEIQAFHEDADLGLLEIWTAQ
jgi:predicted nuclease of predicted toxin-antitoxin system